MRRPVRSHVIRRKMFNGGIGMTKPGASIASGILASSQPLVDIIAQNAINPNRTMPMNQGGVANYNTGGIRYTINEAGDVLRIPISGSQEEADIVANEGLGMLAGLSPDQFKRSDAPGTAFGRALRQGEASVEYAWREHIAKGGDGSTPLVLEDGTIIVGNPDGSGGQLYAKGRGSGQGIYEAPLVAGLTKENIGMRESPNVNIRGFPGDPDVVEKLDSEGQPIVEAEVIEQEKIPVEDVVEQMEKIQSSKKDLSDMITSDTTDTNVDVEKIFKDTTEKTGDDKEVVTEDAVTEDAVTTPTEGRGMFDVPGEGLATDTGPYSESAVRQRQVDRVETIRKDLEETLKDVEPMKQEEILDGYKKLFMDIMPEYKGMTNDEKAFAWIKMGAAIAAGESPNAFANISKGVLATIDEFADDPAQKRKYENQLELSAANYALQRLTADKTLADKDARTVTWFVDKDGVPVPVSIADMLEGNIPEDIRHPNMEIASINALATKATAYRTVIKNLKDELLLTDESARKEQQNYAAAVKKFNDSEVGRLFIEKAMVNLADNGNTITGFRGGFENLLNRGFALAGLDPKKEYQDIAEFRKDIRLAFQKLIPVSLGGVQSANSISNRDVQFLADAYIDSAVLKDGSFSLAGINKNKLMSQLQSTLNIFNQGADSALKEIESIETRLAKRILPGQYATSSAFETYLAGPEGKPNALELVNAYRGDLLPEILKQKGATVTFGPQEEGLLTLQLDSDSGRYKIIQKEQ